MAGTEGRDAGAPPPTTPDGRYIVVRGRLWRLANPHLPDARRSALVAELMRARRAVKAGKAASASDGGRTLAEARQAVDAAKVALGERGPPWWDDGAPDQNRRLVRNTGYAAWFAGLSGAAP